ncbi:MAG: histidinol-phosphatase [Planctomycetia bacterium]|nr:histidinol-phosphatase [Planctomycetia bacterium]
MMQNTMKERLSLAVKMAHSAGKITLKYFLQNNFHVQWKSDASPVTEADQETETFMRQMICEHFPQDAILGEEFPSREGTSGFRWILDPIDGTKSFVHGVPLYGTLIAVEYENESVIGVIHIPATQECVYAMKNSGAFYTRGNSAPLPAQVSECQELKDALILTTSEKTLHKTGRYAGWHALTEKTRLARNWGDCYGYMLVATGRAEVMLDPVMSLWDIAALYPIITEAGGTFTDWRGNKTYTATECVASNGKFHDHILTILHNETGITE